MSWSGQRVTAALAVLGAVVALVGNALAPRYSGDTVDTYRKVADSTRFEVSTLIVLAAVLIVVAAFVGLSRVSPGRSSELAGYGRLAAVTGGAIAVLQEGLQLFAYRQQARAFAEANTDNVVSAFWATNAVDHISGALFATWTIVLLGLAPLLLGAMQLRSGGTGWLGLAAVVGGAVCAVVGVGSLLVSDQSTYDIPFAVGSVLVTLWLLATGVLMWRRADSAEVSST